MRAEQEARKKEALEAAKVVREKEKAAAKATTEAREWKQELDSVLEEHLGEEETRKSFYRKTGAQTKKIKESAAYEELLKKTLRNNNITVPELKKTEKPKKPDQPKAPGQPT